MTDEEIMGLWFECSKQNPPDSLINFARAIEAKVREECKAEWQKGFDEGTIAGYESGQMDMREECAAICDGIAFTVKTVGTNEHGLVADACAEAIRGRGEE